MCLMSKPKIPEPPPVPPPPPEPKPVQFDTKEDPRQAKRLGTRRLQIPLANVTGGGGLRVPQ